MNTITKEEQELIASCERFGGDSRELARLSRRLIAGIENMGTLNGDLCDANFDLGKDLDKLRAENVELVGLISNFCKQHGWSVDGWKNQRHVKPLFDIYEKAKETK